ncbi:IS5 family transposase [Cupriavidus lacunae]|uniref:IS5 family transposase n=1 Tax=Cupriavidus lacunae TaxID=2666307 RepID=A0A370MYU6_9BURK|nr:IS5 family transposase [Cupriavidus lacunae]RDJ98502.1 IS5 family transposase [Cupriavidus lacunae]
MKRQISFAEAESYGKKRVTRRQRFLTEMESVVPWSRLIAAVEPYYPKGKRGRPPIGLERMLRIYFLQQWYGLSDEALEDALYDSMAMRAFAGIDLAVEAVPDATTLLKFRRMLVEHELTRKLFDEIGIMLCERGLLMKEGTIVDATIIEAPPSTKNKQKSRDPEMHQTKKGNEWHFGMKAHVGVDAASGLVHSVVGTAANESDVSQAHALLHGHEDHAFGDAGYTGVEKRDEMQGKSVKWQVAVKRGKIKAMRDGAVKDLLIAVERAKAQIRARVEHPFHVIKNLFGHRKVRYKGLVKNTAQLFSLFGLANLVLARKLLLAAQGSNPQSCPRRRH